MDPRRLERAEFMAQRGVKTDERAMLRNGSTDDPRVSIDYVAKEGFIVRRASAGQFAGTSAMPLANLQEDRIRDDDLPGLWNVLRLNGQRPVVVRGPSRPRLTFVDLFCGCGGLSLGIKWAAEAVGVRPVCLLAVDVAASALGVYSKNLRPLRPLRRNVETLVDYEVPTDEMDWQSLLVDLDEVMIEVAGTVDVVVAGPPCEGHSNFNNVTRRFDYRNDRYFDAVVAGIALDAKVIVIENVPMVKRSFQDVVNRSLQLLRSAGYEIHENEFDLLASDFGTPQDRRRHFLIAGKSKRSLTKADFDTMITKSPTTQNALRPLLGIEGVTTFDRPSNISSDNMKRVEFLFNHDEYDLPDERRPDCHRLKSHNYPSIYGRMHPDLAAPTITTGFLSPGRGRFTHPLEPRSLTPREGARLQGFGEDFDWLERTGSITRNDYANMIGAAVPPQLAFAVGMGALSLL